MITSNREAIIDSSKRFPDDGLKITPTQVTRIMLQNYHLVTAGHEKSRGASVVGPEKSCGFANVGMM